MATTNDLKNGMTLDIDGQLWTVIEFQHVKPGKGPAFVRTKMKQVLTGKVVEKTFNAGIKIEVAILEKRDMQYLYKDGDDFVFMDSKNYDQMTIGEAVVADAVDYMLENCEAIVAVHEGNPLYVELPASVELVVTYTEPGLQGDRSSGGNKPATVETGITVQVPLFIKQDEKILVDTRTGGYLGRANS
jgi:elongation factor P